ncbi:hypothetical protein [Streptomyces sp. NPDC053431]
MPSRARRADGRGTPVVRCAPPPTVDRLAFGAIEQIMRHCLIEASTRT